MSGDDYQTSILDRDTLDDLAHATGAEWLAALLDKYLATTGSMLDDLRAAVTAGDPPRVAKLAHSGKSASRTVGALRLGMELEAIERAAGRANASGLADMASRVDAEFAAAKAQLVEYRASLMHVG